MAGNFDLLIKADTPSLTAEFELLAPDASHAGYQRTDFRTLPAAMLEKLFDLRGHFQRLIERNDQPAALAEVGVAIAHDVLGDEIFQTLWKPLNARALRIQLPAPDQAENSLAAALARVPWEIARPSPNEKTLSERFLLVRVVHMRDEPPPRPLELEYNEPLRVLFVFGAARGSQPLSARRERRALRALFEREIYPQRRVEADFLTHGVTRERLDSQIREHGGYHIVHWSGHGRRNQLELARPTGAPDALTGEQLLECLVGAGGFIPHLFFLSACHSGDIANVRDWKAFIEAARGGEPQTKDAGAAALAAPTGFTGTAHALLAGGVESVVAMRYTVGDDYARDLGLEFYRALLGYRRPQDVAAALTTARNVLSRPDRGPYAACDHATPILYGAADPNLLPPPGRGPDARALGQRLHRIAELTAGDDTLFVGRTWPLADLETRWLRDATAPVATVATVAGLGGMGKTALAAEALDLWEKRFRWVLLYQSKPELIKFEKWLGDIHMNLSDKVESYRNDIAAHPRAAVYLEAHGDFKGPRRYAQMIDNLVRALRAEETLVVLDNFETQLKDAPEPGSGEPVYACRDPVWDEALRRLAEELRGAGSRVLITCRRPLAALAGKASHLARLGPLPPEEATLFLREHKTLSQMFRAEGAEQALALRILGASRFHPLLMDRLARLAAPQHRPQLEQALQTLESRTDFSSLPDLFAATGADRSLETKYIEGALATSIDKLIEIVGPDARRLLWIVALANDPVSFGLLSGVWSGESAAIQQLREMKHRLEILFSLPEALQAILRRMPPELRAQIDALPPAPNRPDPAPLLRRLEAEGLVAFERAGAGDENPDFFCDEVVRERIRRWIDMYPADRGEIDANAVRLGYGERLALAFESLKERNMTAALEAGARALVYCVQAGAYERLSGFAIDLVSSASDPGLPERLIPYLQSAAASAPEGQLRWRCLTYLADALGKSGRPDKSLAIYEQAKALALAAAQAGGEGASGAWADCTLIDGHWAHAQRAAGNIPAARERQSASVDAHRKAGWSEVDVLGNELEALRIDIMAGEAERALPDINERLAMVRDWWHRTRAGETVPEAPNLNALAGALITALDVAKDAHFALNEWEMALALIDECLAIEQLLHRPQVDLASTRGSRAIALIELNRLVEAKLELDACLDIFQSDRAQRASTLSVLARLYQKWGDVRQAIAQESRALALRDAFPDPSARAISHGNLANYLGHGDAPANAVEAARHQLAALSYLWVAGQREHLMTVLRNYVVGFRRARAAGGALAIPRLAELLADPVFDALRQWLQDRRVGLDALQAEIDQFTAAAREIAERPETSP